MSLRSKDVILKKVPKEWHNSCQVVVFWVELLLKTCGAGIKEGRLAAALGLLSLYPVRNDAIPNPSQGIVC